MSKCCGRESLCLAAGSRAKPSRGLSAPEGQRPLASRAALRQLGAAAWYRALHAGVPAGRRWHGRLSLGW